MKPAGALALRCVRRVNGAFVSAATHDSSSQYGWVSIACTG